MYDLLVKGGSIYDGCLVDSVDVPAGISGEAHCSLPIETWVNGRLFASWRALPTAAAVPSISSQRHLAGAPACLRKLTDLPASCANMARVTAERR